jgi:hypothetical protein
MDRPPSSSSHPRPRRRVVPYVGSSRSTTRPPRYPGPYVFSSCANVCSCLGSRLGFRREQTDFLRDVGEWMRTDRLKYREDKSRPARCLEEGKNFGKTLVKVATQSTDGASRCSKLPRLTPSARASSTGEMVRPSALAVIRLMTRSNLVGCWTGNSAGIAPRRILST